MEFRDLKLVIRHSLPMFDYVKRNVGRLLIPIVDMEIDEDDVYLDFHEEVPFILEVDSELIKLRVGDQDLIADAIQVVRSLFDIEPDGEVHFQGGKLSVVLFASDVSCPGGIAFNRMFKSNLDENRVEMELLGFKYSSESYYSNVTLFQKGEGVYGSTTTPFDMQNLSELEDVLPALMDHSRQGLAKVLDLLFKE